MKNKLIPLVIFFLGIILYGLTLRGNFGNPLVDKSLKNISKATGPFESSHERAPYALTVSLIKNRSFSLTKEFVDFASPDTVSVGKKYFIIFPPGISIFAVPFYLLGSPSNMAQLSTFAGLGLFALVNLLILFYIGKHILKFESAISIFVALIFGFASTAWSYSTSLYQHQAITFLVLTSFYAAWKYKQKKGENFFWASWVWISMGLSIWLDYPSIFLVLPNLIYLFLTSISLKKIKETYSLKISIVFLLTSLTFVAIAGVHGIYNHKNFGSWKAIAQLMPRYDLNKIKDTKKDTKIIVPESEKDKKISGVVQEDKLVQGLFILTITSNKGIFFFSPIFLLAVLGIIKALRKINIENGILLFVAVINLVFYASWADPWGGWAFGPRYLIPAMAILAIFVGFWLNNIQFQKIGKFIAFILFVASAGISLLGVLTTTLIPPKVEADYFHMKYNFLLNWDYLMKNESSSFAFNEFFSKFISLQVYYFIILGVLATVAFFVLFILPKWETKK